MNGTALPNERVVIVEIQDGNVRLKTGHIACPVAELSAVGGARETVVRADSQFRPVIESVDEAFEKAFPVDDIHLLKETEVLLLQDLTQVREWFGCIYEDWVVAKIHRALKRLDLSPVAA